jgi:SAM-dependent methyltransferase
MRRAVKSLLRGIIPAALRPGLKTTYRRIRFFGLSGKCPFCRARLRRFLPFGLELPVLAEKQIVGGGFRENALCPVCGSLDRERLVYLYLVNRNNDFSKPCSLLHVAPETQLKKTLMRSSNLRYFTGDLLDSTVMTRMDLTHIPLPTDSFDAIICNHVLEHIPEDYRAMAELYRVLKPGGWAILQVPISLRLESTLEDFSISTPEGRELTFGQRDHVRIYARDYASRLAHAGFQVEVFDWRADSGKFGGPKNLYGLLEGERLYVAGKL